MKHDNLIYILQKKFPEAVHGRDFWVAHPINPESGEQTGEAFIAAWKLDAPQPDEAQIAAWWDQFGEEALEAELCEALRRQRNILLEEADIYVYRAADSGDEAYRSALAVYRQALRDVPQQAGFPHDVTWPELPQE